MRCRHYWPAWLGAVLAVACALVFALVIVADRSHGSRPAPDEMLRPDSEGSVLVLDSYLADMIAGLEARSPRFRAEMDAIRGGSVPLVIGTRAQVVAHLGSEGTSRARLGSIGRFGGSVDQADGSVSYAFVDVALEEIVRKIQDDVRGEPNAEAQARARIDEAVETVLIHELWGHAAPVMRSANWEDTCPDPAPGEPDEEACVMLRENDLRTELGLSHRTRYPVRLVPWP